MFVRFYKIFDYGSIAIILVLLILVLFNLVPKDWYITMLIVSLVLLGLRIVLKTYVLYLNKKIKKGG